MWVLGLGGAGSIPSSQLAAASMVGRTAENQVGKAARARQR